MTVFYWSYYGAPHMTSRLNKTQCHYKSIKKLFLIRGHNLLIREHILLIVWNLFKWEEITLHTESQGALLAVIWWFGGWAQASVLASLGGNGVKHREWSLLLLFWYQTLRIQPLISIIFSKALQLINNEVNTNPQVTISLQVKPPGSQYAM